MNTLAVMCIALHSTSPSCTPLRATTSATWSVMLMNSVFARVVKVKYSVCAFIGLSSGRKSEASRRLLLPDAEQVRLPADVEAAVRHGGRCTDRLLDRTRAQQFELRRRLEDVHPAVLAQGVDLAVDQHRRGGHRTAKGLAPDPLPRLRDMAGGEAPVVDAVDVLAMDQQARHVGEVSLV